MFTGQVVLPVLHQHVMFHLSGYCPLHYGLGSQL